MPKSKSSASSATKKKHARKAAKVREDKLSREHDDYGEPDGDGDADRDGTVGDDVAESLQEDGKNESQTDNLEPLKAADTSIATATLDPGSTSAPGRPLKSAKPDVSGGTGTDSRDPKSAQKQQQQQQQTKAKKKQSKKHGKGQQPPPPRKKQYIPPPKPLRGNVDPVDLYGLGVTGTDYERVPADKVILLRLLNKKDANSTERALEELYQWLSTFNEGSLPEEVQHVVEMLPVWIHHLPKLLSHSSRRARLTSASIQAVLLHRGPQILIVSTKEPLISPATLEQDDYLSCQVSSVFDVDRQVRKLSATNWKALVELIELDTYLSEIISNLTSIVLEEGTSAAVQQQTVSQMSEESRMAFMDERDRKDSLLSSSIDAFSYLVSRMSPDNEAVYANLVESDTFWSMLDSHQQETHTVRRAAWKCLGELVATEAAATLISDNIDIISCTALPAAFRERDHVTQTIALNVLLSLLSSQPQAWARANQFEPDGTSSESESTTGRSSKVSTAPTSAPAPIVGELFDVLQIGFYGNATAGYSAVPQLFQAIPEELLVFSKENVALLFSSFWSAYTGRALDNAGAPGLAAFMAALAKLVDLVGRRDAVETIARDILSDQVCLAWRYFLGIIPAPSKRSTLSTSAPIRSILDMLETLEGVYPGIIEIKWSDIGPPLLQTLESGCYTPSLAVEGLTALLQSHEGAIRHHAKQLLVQATYISLQYLNQPNAMEFTGRILQSHAAALLQDSELSQAIDHASLTVALEAQPFITAYLQTRSSPGHVAACWEHLISTLIIAAHNKNIGSFGPLLSAFASHELDAQSFKNADLDTFVLGALEACLQQPENITNNDIRVFELLLQHPEPIATAHLPDSLVTKTSAFAQSLIEQGLRDGAAKMMEAAFTLPLHLLRRRPCHVLHTSDSETPLFVTLFEIGWVAPLINPDLAQITREARSIWKTLFEQQDQTWSQQSAAIVVAAHLGQLINAKASQSTIFILSRALEEMRELGDIEMADVLQAYLPDTSALAALADTLERMVAPPILATTVRGIELLDVPSALHLADHLEDCAAFLRPVLAWVTAMSENRSLTLPNLWFLRYALLARNLLQDHISLEMGLSFPHMTALQASIQRLVPHMISQASIKLDSQWHIQTTAAISTSADARSGGPLDNVLFGLLREVLQEHYKTYAYRSLQDLLAQIMHYSDISASDAEAWLRTARAMPERDTLAWEAVVLAVKPFLSDQPGFLRYQSEIASSLSGVKPAQALEKGFPILKRLLVVAPEQGCENELLPTHRAVFLMQSLQKWVEADDTTLDDEMLSSLVELFMHLVISLQGTSGSHWDTMFVVMESSIESADWANEASLPSLWTACLFMEEVGRCASSNREFQKQVHTSYTRALGAMEAIFAQAQTASHKQPVSKVVEALGTLLGTSKVGFTTLLPIHLQNMSTPSHTVQLSSFGMAEKLIPRITEELVIDVETASNDHAATAHKLISLPEELVALLRTPLALYKTEPHCMLRSLLAWLLIFDYFAGASSFMKSAYGEQLRSSRLVIDNLLPNLFGLLNVSDVDRGVDLAAWAVEAFVIEDLSDRLGESEAEPLVRLAAHVYFRALQSIPSLIRAVWQSYRSKQKSLAVSHFTAKYFSPVLIEEELQKVYATERARGTVDENVSIKVLPAVNEVKATYLVDEQPLELAVRMPPEYPLSPVEVREGKRVGVPESIWRAWILNVQLVATTQDGSIADALELYRINASRHFEGVEACAICYSVIAASDRSLPNKRCRTCKNAFHPPCLWKWFQTSHSSSCPLCRALF